MATVKCHICSNDAKEKCISCGKVYCVAHIQLVSSRYTCDGCVAKAAITAIVAANEVKKKRDAEIERQQEEDRRTLPASLGYLGMIASVILVIVFIAIQLPLLIIFPIALFIYGTYLYMRWLEVID